MVHALIYDALLLACWLYAMFRGGAPERIGASVLAVGSMLTLAVVSGPAGRFGSVEAGIVVVDIVAAAAFIALALRAERFWPLWIAALQLVGTAGHAVKLVNPEVIPWAYAFALAFWSYPMLLLLAAGTWHHQTRLKRSGADRSWSSFSSPSPATQRSWPTG